MPFNSFDDYPMSWRPCIQRAAGPLYRAIAEALERDIRSGALAPNVRLPPQRELADFLDVNLSTVARAFRLCEAKGLLWGSVGRGTFVAADAASGEPLLRARDQGVVDLGASHPLYGQNVHVVRAMRQVLQRSSVEGLLRYGEAAGSLSHRRCGRLWLGRFGVETEEAGVLLAGGLQNALAVVLASLFHYGDRLATNEVIYPGLKGIAAMLGIRLLPIPYAGRRLDLEALERLLRLEEVRGLYLIPDHHNPTTLTMDGGERRAVAELVRRYGLLCVEDGTYSFLRPEAGTPLQRLAPEETVYVSTVSNALCAGLRIAFLAAPERYRQRLAEGVANVEVMASPFEAETVRQLLESGAAETVLEEKRAELRWRNAVADEVLAGLELWGDGSCQFRWLALPEGASAAEAEAALRARGVQVFGSQRFAVGGAAPRPALRLAVCTPETEDTLRRGLAAVRAYAEG